MSDYEADFFGDCCNTFHEEMKQSVYAIRMGLMPDNSGGQRPRYHIGGRSVIDIGGGPVSLLLKCVDLGESLLWDPTPYPTWVYERYAAHGVSWMIEQGEKLDDTKSPVGGFDEAWIYNVMQHVDDPALVIANARAVARTVRLFEWIEVDPYPGHPQRLERAALEEWLGAPGFVANINESGAVGKAFYGVFAGSS